ncbi:MAG: BRO-N domain-containing protein [Schwartzia sp. (in: firmicutes)]
MKEIITIGNVSGYVAKDGIAWLNAGDVARGWGFVKTETKDGKTYESIRWARVNGYLQEFGFRPQVGENDFLPENMVYRLGFKANNERAQAFQAKLADEVLPAIRKTGSYSAIPKERNEFKEQELKARMLNARVRESNQYLKIAAQIDIPEYRYILQAKSAEALNGGVPVLPLQEVERKTYSATEIGAMFGVSANKIGKVANAHKLKTSEYGKLFYSKSEHSVKEVETWRYYESAIPVFEKIFGREAA